MAEAGPVKEEMVVGCWREAGMVEVTVALLVDSMSEVVGGRVIKVVVSERAITVVNVMEVQRRLAVKAKVEMEVGEEHEGQATADLEDDVASAVTEVVRTISGAARCCYADVWLKPTVMGQVSAVAIEVLLDWLVVLDHHRSRRILVQRGISIPKLLHPVLVVLLRSAHADHEQQDRLI